VFSNDFQQDIDVEIGDEAIPAILSSGFKLFPTECNRNSKQRWDDENEKYQ